MNVKLKIITVGTAILLIFTATLFYFKRQKTSVGSFERKWTAVKVTHSSTINTYNTILSFAANNERIFLNRIYDVAEIDKAGKIIETFALNDKKHLPSEYIIGLDADSSGMYLQDEKAHTLTKLGYDKKVIYQKKTTNSIFRSVHLTGNSFLLKTGSLQDKYANNFFAIYNGDTDQTLTMKDIMPKNSKGGIDTDGFLIRNSLGQVFHIYYYMSGAFEFDVHGKLINKFNTIDGNSTPPPVITTENGFVSSPDARVIHLAGCADNKCIYIASTVIAKGQQDDMDDNFVIDVYDTHTLRYIHSISIPSNTNQGLNTFLVKNNIIYVITGGKYLTIYNI